MALKFRRGSTADKSGSLSFGEPYLNSTLGTLQVGGASGDITLATQGNTSELVALSLSASSFVSASTLHITSNAEIKGNLVLGGNITIGDQTSDTVAVNANLSSSIIPSLTNTFDLGSADKAWRDLYISTGSIKLVDPGSNTVVGTLTSNASGDFKVSGELSGSTIAGLGNAQAFSSSISSTLTTLNSYTSSNTDVNSTQNNRLSSLEVESGSVRTTFNSYTSSANGRLDSLETESGSVRADFTNFSSSIANSIQLTGSAVTIKGDLLVKGTTTTINSTTINIEDNIVQLNGSATSNGGVQVLDSTSGETGSLLWDNTNNYWKGGAIGSEEKIVLESVLNSFSSSVNSYTSSNDSTNTTQNNRLGSLETESGSIRSDFNSYTSSANSVNNTQNLRLDSLEGVSGSYATTGSNEFIGEQTITGSLVTSGSKVEFNVVWPAAPGEQHIVKTNPFTIGSREYAYAGFALEHFEETPGTYHNAWNIYMFDDNYSYGSEMVVGPLRNHLRIYPSGSGGNIGNVSVQDIQDGRSQALVYGDVVQIGGFHAESILIGNTSSIIEITGSSILVNSPLTSDNKIVAASLTGSIDYDNLTNVPTLLSGSSQITISDTTGYSTFSSSIATTDLNQNNRLDAIETATASLNTFTSSINTTIKSKLDTEGVISGSSQITLSSTTGYTAYSESVATLNDSTNTALSTSIAATDLSQNNRLDTIESRYATTGSNQFKADQTITGSLTITQNLTVLGSSSLLVVTSSQLAVSASFISVNVFEPAERFGGLKVYDSGSESHLATASLLWDSQENHWIYQNASGSTYSGGMLISGPRNTGSLGEEVGLKSGKIAKSVGGDHIDNSIMNEESGVIYVTGSLVASTVISGSIKATNGVISGSSQITSLPSVDTDDLTEGVTNRYYLDSRVKTKLDAEGVISGSSQVFSNISGDITIASNGVATIGANSVALGTDTSGDYVASLVAGTNITLSNNSGEGATPTIGLTNNAITIAGTSTALGSSISAATIGNAIGAFSGSSQVDHNATTNYSANRHIDHTAVSIATGFGLSGGGDISSTRTLSVDTTGVASVSGSQTLTNKTISGASNTLSNIANASLTNSSVTVTAGTGLSGGGAVSLGSSVTLTNAGVTSNVAGSGISVSGATGAVTITNTGVTSNVAGTGVTVSGATGAVTISIGQAVATSSNVQFNSLGVGMAASATAGRIDATNDVVAYSSSDRRFKDNIKPIENPLEKISKISGNTFDWKEENKIEHGYDGNDVGVIAQEIEAVLPQLVQTRESGYKAVKYDKLVALLIEGIKEQQIQINDMKVEIENLKKQKGL